jgi:hypothetical protein
MNNTPGSHLHVLVAVLVLAGSVGIAEELPSADGAIGPPPAELGLDPFYKKHLSVDGFPVVSSGKAHDAALREAAWIVGHMLSTRPDLLQALKESGTRLSVMAATELTTDIPEHSDLTPANYWNRRARGLGASRRRPSVSCGEENLLRYPGDPYATESILVHEFSHAIHGMGLRRVDREFDGRLRECYRQALDEGLWKDTYAATNASEYWAEGVQSYFDTNRPPDAVHNHVDTREELQTYDPRLFALIDGVFRGNEWRYTRPDRRDDAGGAHLAGYDPETAPRFRWPEGLEEWYENYQKERDRRRTRDERTPGTN